MPIAPAWSRLPPRLRDHCSISPTRFAPELGISPWQSSTRGFAKTRFRRSADSAAWASSATCRRSSRSLPRISRTRSRNGSTGAARSRRWFAVTPADARGPGSRRWARGCPPRDIVTESQLLRRVLWRLVHERGAELAAEDVLALEDRLHNVID